MLGVTGRDESLVKRAAGLERTPNRAGVGNALQAFELLGREVLRESQTDVEVTRHGLVVVVDVHGHLTELQPRLDA